MFGFLAFGTLAATVITGPRVTGNANVAAIVSSSRGGSNATTAGTSSVRDGIVAIATAMAFQTDLTAIRTIRTGTNHIPLMPAEVAGIVIFVASSGPSCGRNIFGADVTRGLMDISAEEKQALLETVDLKSRLDKLLEQSPDRSAQGLARNRRAH